VHKVNKISRKTLTSCLKFTVLKQYSYHQPIGPIQPQIKQLTLFLFALYKTGSSL
jgi:hypothetical protein